MKTAIATLILALAAGTAHGQGFNIQRHEPTAAGEWSFAVDHPWYTRSKYFGAAGITLDYAHNPLVFGTVSGGTFSKTQAVVGHQLTLHLDLIAGAEVHHIVEALFKAFGRALAEAVALDAGVKGVPSTKGVLE